MQQTQLLPASASASAEVAGILRCVVCVRAFVRVRACVCYESAVFIIRDPCVSFPITRVGYRRRQRLRRLLR